MQSIVLLLAQLPDDPLVMSMRRPSLAELRSHSSRCSAEREMSGALGEQHRAHVRDLGLGVRRVKTANVRSSNVGERLHGAHTGPFRYGLATGQSPDRARTLGANAAIPEPFAQSEDVQGAEPRANSVTNS